MEEDTEYLKLPLEDRCIHKLWKARVNGYEECTTYFAKITDEKSPEFTKFAPLMKKFVTDSNAVALDKALDAVLLYVENAHIAGRTAGEVTAGIVTKCLAAPKKTTQEKALDVLLMYCEIEKYDAVQEELIKGFAQKNPKVVCGCVKALAHALREFGGKVISIKLLAKCIGSLLEDRDKNVRDEAKKMVIEMYRWVGPALKPQLTSLKPIQIQELEVEFSKLPNEKTVQKRFLRSQQELKSKLDSKAGEEEGEEEEVEDDGPENIDSFDILSAVNILDQLPKDFYEKVEAKKWQDRKEAMEILLPLSLKKLEPGDYAELVKALKKIIAKDTNVMVIALAGQCLTGLAKGLRKKFSIYAVSCIETILEKFKEKKQNVVTSLREAVDAIFQSTAIDAVQEVSCAALKNKNPNVKAETAAFLARSFTYCTPTILNKKLLKAFVIELIKTLNESDPTVRDNSAEAIGAMLKVVGEKVLDPFICGIEALKLQKIKESAEKVELKVKIKVVKPKEAVVSSKSFKDAVIKPSSANSLTNTKTSRHIPGVIKKVGKALGGPVGEYKGGGSSRLADSVELTYEEAVAKVQGLIPEECLFSLADSNWKVRLSAMEDFNTIIQALEAGDIPTQALIKILAEKPGLKDNNFQVLKLKLDVLLYLADRTSLNRLSAEICLQDLVERFADPKNGSYVGKVLSAIAEGAKLQWVGVEVLKIASEQKNPKIAEMALKWLSDAIKEFGFVLQPKSIITHIKSAMSHNNPSVRTTAVDLTGTIFLYMGPSLRVFFSDEKAAILQLIDAEFKKLSDEIPPTPTRGQNRTNENMNEGEDEDDGAPKSSSSGLDVFPRVNITAQITSNLISELADKNWKVRIEALSKVASILNEAKFVLPDLGELPVAICARLSDTNKNIAAEALRITSSLATALGPHCKPHTRTIIPGIFSALGDTKQSMRQQALAALNNWVDHLGSIKEVIDGEMCIDSLKSGSPFLKFELILWMSEKLKDAPSRTLNKEELFGCIGFIFSGLEDRNADVRKASSEAIYPFMLHLGYEAMVRQTSKVKPSSKNTVMQALEKAKISLPVPTSASQLKNKVPTAGGASYGSGDGLSSTRTVRGAAAKRGNGKSNSASSKGGVGSSRKEEEIDNSPLLQYNNMKQQRIIEEQRMRTLRWDFPTPRAEFIAQLKDQMLSANINRQLVANMFHQDFKFHIKSIDALAEDLNDNVDACVSNLDLILRWLTIRFFDTNPSVILKAMEYLKNVFAYLSNNEYHLADYEAYSFLPFLVMKFGDPKDAIRGPAREIIKKICDIYPASKVSSYILEGLKSKNARLRTECLDTLGSLIESYGISVCQPSPGVALKEVARQIADRDNAVRNAALNSLLQVYYKEGEKVYKLIGNISDKDHTLLEERIRRASKNKPVIKKPAIEPEPIVPKALGLGSRPNRIIPIPAVQSAPILRDGVTEVTRVKRFGGPRPLSGDMSNANARFQIDFDFMEKLVDDKISITRPKYELEEIPDIASILNDKMTCPTSRLTRPGFTSAMRANMVNANIDLEDAAHAINMVIAQVTTPDVNTVISALSQIDYLIQSDEKRTQLMPHIDQLLITATLQYRLVLNTKMADTNIHKEECIRIYRSLTNCLMNIFNNKELGIKATRDVLHDVIHSVISILLDSRLTHLDDGPQIIKALNILVVRIIEKAQFTQIFSALLKLLHESVGNGVNSKFTELVMKCNWKGIRILPTRAKEVNVVQILLDTHDFLEAYPSNSWIDKPVNTPLRTIKTVLHNLVKVYGNSILTYLSKIPNIEGSEIEKYILKDLNSLQNSSEVGITDSNKMTVTNQFLDPHQPSVNAKSPKKLTKAANNTLSEIFKKIGSKENTKEGLIQLYEFKQKNPEVDIDSYLRKSSHFFQNYIERGLKKVEMERQSENITNTTGSLEGTFNAAPLSSIQVNEPNNLNVNELVDQFKEIAAQAGFDNAYIDSAVKNIYSKENGEPLDEEFLRTVSSELHLDNDNVEK